MGWTHQQGLGSAGSHRGQRASVLGKWPRDRHDQSANTRLTRPRLVLVERHIPTVLVQATTTAHGWTGPPLLVHTGASGRFLRSECSAPAYCTNHRSSSFPIWTRNSCNKSIKMLHKSRNCQVPLRTVRVGTCKERPWATFAKKTFQVAQPLS